MFDDTIYKDSLDSAAETFWAQHDIETILSLIPEDKRALAKCKIQCYGIGMFYEGIICELSSKK